MVIIDFIGWIHHRWITLIMGLSFSFVLQRGNRLVHGKLTSKNSSVQILQIEHSIKISIYRFLTHSSNEHHGTM